MSNIATTPQHVQRFMSLIATSLSLGHPTFLPPHSDNLPRAFRSTVSKAVVPSAALSSLAQSSQHEVPEVTATPSSAPSPPPHANR